jgi:hypothetical protein
MESEFSLALLLMSTSPTPDPLAQIKELLFRGEKIAERESNK